MKLKYKALCTLLAVLIALTNSYIVIADNGSAYVLNEDIMIDGGFEENKWDISDSAGFEIDENVVKSGTKALKITGTETSQRITSADILITKDGAYRISLWAKTLDFIPLSGLTIGLEGQNGVITSFQLDGTMEWENLSVDIPSINTGTVRVFAEVAEGATGTAWIDGITLYSMSRAVFDVEEDVADDNSKMFNDISDSEYCEQIETVYSLGLIPSETSESFAPDAGITRGNFAGIILSLLGHNTTITENYDGKPVYTDVPSGSSLFNQIMYVTKLDYMHGYGDGTFRPSEKLTLNETIKIFVSMLNLDAVANQQGGYPFGYYTVANNSKLLKNLGTVDGDAVVTRGQMAALIYNLLEADAYEETSYMKDALTLTGPVSYAKLHLDIAIGTGIVDANEYTGLSSSYGTKAGSVLIDGVEYYSNSTNAENCLGYKVKYYAKITEDEPDTLLYISPIVNKNIVLDLSAEEIERVSRTSAGNFEVSYRNENGKLEDVMVPLNADVIYNGIYYGTPDSNDFKPVYGNVTFIDNNRDDIYDVVFISSAVIYRVATVSSAREFITDANGKPQLDFDTATNYAPIITKAGNKISLSNIVKDDVLFVYKTKQASGKGLTTIEVYNRKTTGTVNQTDGREEVILGSYRYPISDALFLTASVNSSGDIVYSNTYSDILELGDNGTVWLDRNGKIIDFDSDSFGGINYGYLVAAGASLGIDSTVTVRILDQDGTYYDYETARKIELDGQKISIEDFSDPDLILTLANGATVRNTVFGTTGAKEQLIRYSLNASGQISYVDTASVGVNEDDKTLMLSSDTAQRRCNGVSKILSNSTSVYVPEKGAKVFVIPGTGYKPNRDFEYSVTDSSTFSNDQLYTLRIYDADEFNRGDAFVLIQSGDSEMVAVNSTLMLVTETGTGIGADGNECVMLKGMSKGVETTLYGTDDLLSATSDRVGSIQAGDVIRFQLGGNGMLRYLDHVKNMLTDDFGVNYSLYNSNNLLVYGKVIANEGVYIILEHPSANGAETLRMLYVCSAANANIYEYSRSKSDSAVVASINDVSVGDRMFLRLHNTNLQDAVIVCE